LQQHLAGFHALIVLDAKRNDRPRDLWRRRDRPSVGEGVVGADHPLAEPPVKSGRDNSKQDDPQHDPACG
jgi:hypothetical protein